MIGTGAPARFRFSDAPARDNSGVLTVTIQSDAECTAASCLSKSGLEFDQAAAPRIAASPVSVPVVGSRTCGLDKVLTVRLTQPKGVKFRKTAYYLQGKKLRVVGRSTMFQKGTHTQVLRAQKFRNLPSGVAEAPRRGHDQGRAAPLRASQRRSLQPRIKARTIKFV